MALEHETYEGQSTLINFAEASNPALYHRTFTIAEFVLDRFFSVRYHGLEHIPREGPAILVVKHAHMSDIPLTGVAVGKAVGRQVRFVAKDSLFRIPFLGPYINAHDALDVTRGKPRLSQSRAMIKTAEHGYLLGFFAEGTRIRGNRVGQLKSGLQLIVRSTEVPVIPMGLASFLGYRIGVSVGEPITFEDYKNAAPENTSKKQFGQFILDHTRSAMQHELDNAYELARHDPIKG